MDYQKARDYFLGKPETLEDFPFGPDVAVFKIKGKMFGTLGIDDDIPRMNLKCDPQEALMLRDMFEAIIPGYHMNKKHWNTVLLDGSVPLCELERMIDRSYGLVIKGLKKSERQTLELRYSPEVLYK